MNLKLLPQDAHWYASPSNPEIYYPSVTAVTSYLPKGKFFERYLADQESFEDAQRILKEAGARGTRVHDATEVLDRGGTIPYNGSGLTDEEYQLMTFYIAWHKKYKPQIIHVEIPVVSDKHKLGGKIDRIYKIDGKNVLLDIKTSKSAIYDSHWIQVAAYSDMYEFLFNEKIDYVAILRLTSKRKEGFEYVVRSRKEWKEDYKQFKKTYDTMMYLNDNKLPKPKFIEVPEVLSLQ